MMVMYRETSIFLVTYLSKKMNMKIYPKRWLQQLPKKLNTNLSAKMDTRLSISKDERNFI